MVCLLILVAVWIALFTRPSPLRSLCRMVCVGLTPAFGFFIYTWLTSPSAAQEQAATAAFNYSEEKRREAVAVDMYNQDQAEYAAQPNKPQSYVPKRGEACRFPFEELVIDGVRTCR